MNGQGKVKSFEIDRGIRKDVVHFWEVTETPRAF